MITGSEPVYPCDLDVPNLERGITIRQHFASLFMAATMGNPEAMAYLSKLEESEDYKIPAERIAKKSVQYADVLIAELNKHKQ